MKFLYLISNNEWNKSLASFGVFVPKLPLVSSVFLYSPLVHLSTWKQCEGSSYIPSKTKTCVALAHQSKTYPSQNFPKVIRTGDLVEAPTLYIKINVHKWYSSSLFGIHIFALIFSWLGFGSQIWLSLMAQVVQKFKTEPSPNKDLFRRS